MTEKRFTVLYGIDENPFEWDIVDNQRNAIIEQGNGIAICNKLNELHEKNQQLKKEIIFFQKELRDCYWKSRELTLSEVEDAIEKIKRYE